MGYGDFRMTTVDDVILSSCEIPPMPNVAHQILVMVADPNTTSEKLQKAISVDQALATRILKIANSPFYGVPRTIRTLSTAIMILGFGMIRNIVLAVVTKSINRKVGLTEAMMWEHAVGVSTASFLVAKEIHSPDPEEAFLAGLLHDIGKQILNNHDPEKYMQVIEKNYNDSVPFYTAEEQLFGFNHTEVGALVVKKWKLSEELENAIRYHHKGYMVTLKEYPFYAGKISLIVNLADLLCLKMGIGTRKPIEEIDIVNSESALLLKLSEDKLKNLVDVVYNNYQAEKEKFWY
ncbi:MAG: HDOD domain-containing protein [Nitrospirae bacterium]|nr:HDOD domain-containing protein [Nitrospirota bacterium]